MKGNFDLKKRKEKEKSCPTLTPQFYCWDSLRLGAPVSGRVVDVPLRVSLPLTFVTRKLPRYIVLTTAIVTDFIHKVAYQTLVNRVTMVGYLYWFQACLFLDCTVISILKYLDFHFFPLRPCCPVQFFLLSERIGMPYALEVYCYTVSRKPCGT